MFVCSKTFSQAMKVEVITTSQNFRRHTQKSLKVKIRVLELGLKEGRHSVLFISNFWQNFKGEKKESTGKLDEDMCSLNFAVTGD